MSEKQLDYCICQADMCLCDYKIISFEPKNFGTERNLNNQEQYISSCGNYLFQQDKKDNWIVFLILQCEKMYTPKFTKVFHGTIKNDTQARIIFDSLLKNEVKNG